MIQSEPLAAPWMGIVGELTLSTRCRLSRMTAPRSPIHRVWLRSIYPALGSVIELCRADVSIGAVAVGRSQKFRQTLGGG